MKRIITLSLLGALMLTGCIGDSAENTAEEFFTAFKNGDVEDYKKYSTDSTKALFSFKMGMECRGMNLNKDSDLSKCMKKAFGDIDKIKAVGSKEDGNPTSKIVTVELHKKSGKIEKTNVAVEKFDGEWKVNLKK